jgi:hypothetical protein
MRSINRLLNQSENERVIINEQRVDIFDDEVHKVIDIQQFPTCYGTIRFPERCLLMRGYDTRYPVLSERPAYFTTSEETASCYVRDARCKIGLFETTKDLRLFDLRFMKNIIRDLFVQRKSNAQDVIQTCFTLALSYGICSLEKQLSLLKMRFPKLNDDGLSNLEKFLQDNKENHTMKHIDPVELQGVRIGMTDNDAEAVMILKEIFGSLVDGYVAPRMFSPFHYQTYYNCAEIVLFEPVKVLKQITNSNIKYNIHRVKLSDLFTKETLRFPMKGMIDTQIHFEQLQGGKPTTNNTNKYIYTYDIEQKLSINTLLSSSKMKKKQNKIKSTVSKLLGGTEWFYSQYNDQLDLPMTPWKDTEYAKSLAK